MEKLLTLDKGLFYVIEFFDGIQIVPDNWIVQDETLVYWPKVKSDKNYDTIVYTRSSIKDDWSLEPIKTILYKTDSFSNAKIKLKKAEYQSNVDSPYNTDVRKKQRRDNAKVQFNDSSDSEPIYKKKRMVKPKKTNLPSLPEPPLTTMHNKTNILNTPSIVNIKSLASTSQTCTDPLSLRNQTYMEPLISRNQKLTVSVLPFDHKKENNHEDNQILKALRSLKMSINDIISLIQELIKRLDTLEKNESLKMQSVLDEYNAFVNVFPIKTKDSLKEVESNIENNLAFREKLIINLKQLSSADIKKTIRNILHYLISNEMAQQYSWLGQRNKAAFQNLHLSKILILVVKMRHQESTHEQISSIAKEWLKHAKQRVQRKSEKKEKYVKNFSDESDLEIV